MSYRLFRDAFPGRLEYSTEIVQGYLTVTDHARFVNPRATALHEIFLPLIFGRLAGIPVFLKAYSGQGEGMHLWVSSCLNSNGTANLRIHGSWRDAQLDIHREDIVELECAADSPEYDVAALFASSAPLGLKDTYGYSISTRLIGEFSNATTDASVPKLQLEADGQGDPELGNYAVHWVSNDGDFTFDHSYFRTIVETLLTPAGWNNRHTTSGPISQYVSSRAIELGQGGEVALLLNTVSGVTSRAAVVTSPLFAQSILTARETFNNYVMQGSGTASAGIPESWQTEVRGRFTDVDDAISEQSDLIIAARDQIVELFSRPDATDRALLEGLQAILKNQRKSTFTKVAETSAVVGAAASVVDIIKK